MKKYLAFLSLIASAGIASAALTTSISLTNIQTGNLLTNIGSFTLVSMTVTADSTTNAAVFIYDSPTNGFTYSPAQYTNIYSYQTNVITSYTDYYGNSVLLTNIEQVDVTNNLVTTVTNNYPLIARATAAGSGNTTYPNLNRPIMYGLYFTNPAVVPVTVVVTYRR